MSLWQPPDVAGMRVSYEGGQLLESDLAPTPLWQFQAWFTQVQDFGLPEPNAMILATADDSGAVSARTVLLKGVDERGFVFFSNYTSRKAAALAANPQASVVFPWFAMHRQVTVIGQVEQVSQAETAEYFRSRPHGSQVAAWASRQSSAIDSRETIEARLAALAERWPEGTEVPVPDFWGGYLIRATSVEFWHGRVSRMHDRLRYQPAEDAESTPLLNLPDAWRVQRYAP